MMEENMLIENETSHVKVFRVPNRKSFPKNFILVSVCGILTLLILGGFVFWVSVSFFSEIEESKNDRQQASWHTVLNMGVSGVLAVWGEADCLRNGAAAMSKVQSLLNYLRRISGPQTISGVYVYNSGTHSNESVQVVQNIAGVSRGVISTKMPKYDSNETVWNYFIDEVITNWKNHHLLRILWATTENPFGMMKRFVDTRSGYNAEQTWRDLIEDGGDSNKLWKEQLDNIAPYFHKLQNAGVIPILDILHNINDEEDYWKGRPGVNGSMELYKMSHDYLIKVHNLSSLIWMWSLRSKYMTRFEEFWPGSDYVDVVAVHMSEKKELSINEYQRLINLVGDTPLAMEIMVIVPNVELLAAQPRWTWFTARDDFLQSTYYNSVSSIQATFNSVSVINRGNIDFFNEIN